MKLLNPKLYFSHSSLQEDRRKTTALFSAWRILDSPWIDASLVYSAESEQHQRIEMKGKVAGLVKRGTDVPCYPTGDRLTHQRWLSEAIRLQSSLDIHIWVSLTIRSLYLYGFWVLTMEHSKYVQVWKSVHDMRYIYSYVSWLFKESLHKVLSVLY